MDRDNVIRDGSAKTPKERLPLVLKAALAGVPEPSRERTCVVLRSVGERAARTDGAQALPGASERTCVAWPHPLHDRMALTVAWARNHLLLGNASGWNPADVSMTCDAARRTRVDGRGAWRTLGLGGSHFAFATSHRGPVGFEVETAGRAPVVNEVAEGTTEAEQVLELYALAGGPWLMRTLRAAGSALAAVASTGSKLRGICLRPPMACSGHLSVRDEFRIRHASCARA